MFTRGEFGARILLAADPPRPRRPAAAREVGQPLERYLGAAEMTEQGTKGARADIV
jgi:hypothetical protein